MITEDQVKEAMRRIIDPDIGISILELGLIYGVEIQNEGKQVTVSMTLTSPACPAGPMLIAQVESAARSLEGVEKASVELVWSPPWNPREMASDEVKDMLGIW